MAIFRCGNYLAFQVNLPEFGNVIDDDEIRVQVNDAVNIARDDISEVDSGVIEGLV